MTSRNQIEDFDPSTEAMLQADNDQTLAIIDSFYNGEISEAEMYRQIEDFNMNESFMSQF